MRKISILHSCYNSINGCLNKLVDNKDLFLAFFMLSRFFISIGWGMWRRWWGYHLRFNLFQVFGGHSLGFTVGVLFNLLVVKMVAGGGSTKHRLRWVRCWSPTTLGWGEATIVLLIVGVILLLLIIRGLGETLRVKVSSIRLVRRNLIMHHLLSGLLEQFLLFACKEFITKCLLVFQVLFPLLSLLFATISAC